MLERTTYSTQTETVEVEVLILPNLAVVLDEVCDREFDYVRLTPRNGPRASVMGPQRVTDRDMLRTAAKPIGTGPEYAPVAAAELIHELSDVIGVEITRDRLTESWEDGNSFDCDSNYTVKFLNPECFPYWFDKARQQAVIELVVDHADIPGKCF